MTPEELAAAALQRRQAPEEDQPSPKMNGQSRPLLKINGGDLPATARELAQYLAADDHFLSNGNTPVMIITSDDIPRAVPVTIELVRTAAHELCQPVRWIKDKWVDQT